MFLQKSFIFHLSFHFVAKSTFTHAARNICIFAELSDVELSRRLQVTLKAACLNGS